ncbi:MAG: helicase-associated domain-containing protein [Sphaerochaetaceae bacterium]|nr:helicase-associated domain-containing protein [Sphaerochaetaceae bacterium]
MDKPLIVQSDKSLLLDIHSPEAENCRKDIVSFSELVKAPEHIHTYCISSISIWNANSAGLDTKEILFRLQKYSKFEIPSNLISYLEETSNAFGKSVLVERDNSSYLLKVLDPIIAKTIINNSKVSSLIQRTENPLEFVVNIYNRGNLKVEMIHLGFPVFDKVPLNKGEYLPISLKIGLRDYQNTATMALLGNMGPGTGYGTIVMPCGSGKTVVGLSIMSALQTRTLILCPNIVAVHQWIDEIINKTSIDPSLIGEYSGEKKEIKPITVCTYQVLTYRHDKSEEFKHMNLVKEGNWGLVIYDEVHMLPAHVFKITAELQSVYRVGLTATLIREDGKEEEVFSLVGPKRYDIPWTDLTKQGWIASANCVEIKVPLNEEQTIPYAIASKREKYKIASTNTQKNLIIDSLLEKHRGENILIIGQYLDQLKDLQKRLGFPIITGTTANAKRDSLYKAFKEGKEKVLIVSKVANFAIDLPDANIAIQISGTFGSRQEEAQRLGRILRPKNNPCYFYTIVSKFTVEEEFSANRQKFLVEQGYKYSIREY